MSWLSSFKRKSIRKSKKGKRNQKLSGEATDTATQLEGTVDVASSEANGVPAVIVTEPGGSEDRCVSPSDTTGQEKAPNTTVQVISSRPRKLRPQPQSVASDIGYSSRSTLDPFDSFRGRTSTESSGSTMYYSPQGSSNPSPTGSGDVPPLFPPPATLPSKTPDRELFQSMNEQLVRLVECVKSLEAGIDRLSGRVTCMEEKMEHLRPRAVSAETQTIEMRTCASLPDLSVLPNSQCDKKVILCLVEKVTDWRFLARWLDLEDNDITRIETDFPRSDREQCYQMFVRLKAVKPENSTYRVLGHALQRQSQELYYEYVKEVQQIVGS